MNSPFLFSFKTDISGVASPKKLNNPFVVSRSEIATIACKEFQQYLTDECHEWDHNFKVDKGKMFGVLVVERHNKRYFIATVSGKLKGIVTSPKFVPSVFEECTEDYRINKGMSELTQIGAQITASSDPVLKEDLINSRKQKSKSLQNWLFDNYKFLNINGKISSVTTIFKEFNNAVPPAAAGECAAPKLLHFALKHELKPVAIAEFWWGIPSKSEEREHLAFYPACKNKCQAILEYILDDNSLYHNRLVKL
ncbi:MAG: hypothetical protein ABJG68_07200 [Crocinitomicaceae bacterium]